MYAAARRLLRVTCRMIIVYGTRSSEFDTRLPAPCGHCGQVALLQSDWRRYFHVMFIPTFPIESHRSINCQACGNGFETKGSTPLWTFIGTILVVVGVLGAAGGQVIRHFAKASAASITAATAQPPASASAAPPPTPSVSAPPPPKAAPKPVALSPSSHGAKPAHPTPPASAHRK